MPNFPSTFNFDVIFGGTVTFQRAVSLPAATINNSNISPSAAIQASKIEQQYDVKYAQPNVAAVAETKFLHRVFGATATVVQIAVGVIGAATSTATATVDVKKNGTSILSTSVVIDNSVAAYGAVLATISNNAAVRGDVYTVSVTVSGSTLPTGLFVDMTLGEDPT